MSIIEKIKNRINDLDEGEIIMTSNFTDISSITTIRKCLGSVSCTDSKKNQKREKSKA